jgi:uncharacterized protein YhbP (UPF0306 family)
MTDTIAAALAMLRRYNTATLATSGDDGPWAATVFYACDDQLSLYFVSAPGTRHARHLAANPGVALSIYTDCSNWADISGLQLTGEAVLLSGAERDAGLQRYLDGLPAIGSLVTSPRTADERLVGERLAGAGVYRFAPRWLRIIDNSRGFGFKQELELRPPA